MRCQLKIGTDISQGLGSDLSMLPASKRGAYLHVFGQNMVEKPILEKQQDLIGADFLAFTPGN